MAFIDKAVGALLDRGQTVNFVPRDGSKIADITHADTAEHTITHATLGIPANVVLMLINYQRIGGTGVFRPMTKTASQKMTMSSANTGLWPIDDGGDFRYALSVNGDDWDIHCFGYWIQGRLKG